MNGRFNPNDFPTIESKRLRSANVALLDTIKRYRELLQGYRNEIIRLNKKVEEMTRNVTKQ